MPKSSKVSVNHEINQLSNPQKFSASKIERYTVQTELQKKNIIHVNPPCIFSHFPYTNSYAYWSISFHVQTVALTSEKVVQCLDKHSYWAKLTVLSRFLLALSFNNKVNGKNNFNTNLSILVW